MKRGVLWASVAVLGACAKSAEPPSAAVTELHGAGSSFVAPLVFRWAEAFAKAHPDVHVAYQSLGSSAGVEQAMQGAVDFAGTEAPVADEQLREMGRDKGYALLHLPAAVGGVVPAYNLPGVEKELRFTGAALAGIFLGTIKKWNDPALVAANPGVELPEANIIVVHRSDGSGTSYIWTDYLSKVSDEWKSKGGRGASIAWPVGLGAKGNEGVSAKVNVTPNALGYVELVYALRSKLQYGAVQNRAGEFVTANVASLAAAGANASQPNPDEFRVSLTDGEGTGVYPVAGFTWLLVPTHFGDAAKEKATVAFLSWALEDGQATAESLSYARLPAIILSNERRTLAHMQ